MRRGDEPEEPDELAQDRSTVEQTASRLRARAERRLGGTSPGGAPSTLAEAAQLLHELHVHRIELELQNEELRRAQAELEASRARYFDLYDLAPVGYLSLSEAGLIEEANLAAAALLSTPRAALLGQPFSRFLCDEDRALHYGCLRALRSTGAQQRCELRLAGGEGPPIWVLAEAAPAPQGPSGEARWRSVLIDITTRKHDEQALSDAQARLRLAADVAELTFAEWDPRRDQLMPSSSMREPPEPAMTLEGWGDRIHPEDRPRVIAAIRAFARSRVDTAELQYRVRHNADGYRWNLTRLETLGQPDGQLERVLLVHQDVTLRKQSEDRAVYMAQHDPLTGLPSRALLDQLAAHMIAGAERAGTQLAVLFFDLDRFKAVNDLLGHEAGDQLLQAVAQRLRTSFRAEDLVSRLGGDEFVVVMANIPDAEEAARAARQAIATLARPYDIDGQPLPCAASLGISLFPRDGRTLGTLMQRADLAMYQAKQMGSGRYQFVTEALNRKVETTARLEQQLRQAVADHELRLVYQPMVDIASGRVAGVEALLRWPQPRGTPIPPATFVPMAEAIHVIHEIGQWVVREAVRQQALWREARLPRIPISVNVSSHQLYHPRFLPELAALIRELDADPSALSMQVSEAALLESPSSAKRLLSGLKALGIALVMDDFGLGCSSLCQLEDFPLDGLAVNRVLFERLHTGSTMPAVMDVIVHLGQALKLPVTAVGIESQADLSFVRAHQCSLAQGDYLGAPMSGDEFVAWYGRYSGLPHSEFHAPH
ncbi:putative bifunctional diguanylate cyclase/phosphodiesterase [Thiorhodococcus minor]|uniref:EAL domain-containing protein n=1 Tax=Thiorhodococcus minor TaxID=57489 RepID=A0A6M0K3B0_9GAMM|nr:GGDEF and EAL domain-containing protein [Thiorhodococcus minor]NEV63774.1 EAL domain-containing protein [Thiorhodococcus minor]